MTDILSNDYYQYVRKQQEHLPSDQSEWGREEHIASNMKMVVALAKQYHKKTGLPLEELIGEGNLGLVTAWDKYRPQTGAKFSSVAYFWIRAGILSYIKKNSPHGENMSLEEYREMYDDDMQLIYDDDPLKEDNAKYAEKAFEGLTNRDEQLIRQYFGIGCKRKTLTAMNKGAKERNVLALKKRILKAIERIKLNCDKYGISESEFRF